MLLECVQQALAEVAAGRPPIGGPHGAQDLERDAEVPERLDALDSRGLQDPALPDWIGGHLSPDLVDDLDRLVDIGAICDRHVLVDA